MNIAELISSIDKMMSLLDNPLTDNDIDAGWTPASADATKKLLENVRQMLDSGKPVPQLSIVRGLDSWGITYGEKVIMLVRLFDEIEAYSSSK